MQSSSFLILVSTDKPCANRPGKEREEILEEEIQALSLVRIYFFHIK